MSRRTIWIAAGVVVLVLGLFLIAHPRSQSPPVHDGKEPEIEGLRIVRFSGDAKLSSLLAAPQFKAAKNELSNYIQSRYGANVYTATIIDTVLQNDGSITVDVNAGAGRTFEAIIQSGPSDFIFSVPATNYRTSTPQSLVLNQFSGFN